MNNLASILGLVAVVVGLLILPLLLMLAPVAPLQPQLTAAEIQAEHPSWALLRCQRIADHAIWLGMPDEQVLLSRGKPADINRSVGSYGVHEQWVYENYPQKYLYFEDGILTSWQET